MPEDEEEELIKKILDCSRLVEAGSACARDVVSLPASLRRRPSREAMRAMAAALTAASEGIGGALAEM